MLRETEIVRLQRGEPAGARAVSVQFPVPDGDPSTEDLTARTLHGLVAAGLTASDPAVCKAIEFLRTQQLPDGSWWGRWTNSYVPTTAFALIGLHAVDADLAEPWMQRAVEWLLSKQNSDGGWGESHLSFRRPELAGVAASMPPVTGLVVAALCKIGLGDDFAVQHGVRYLLEQQQSDGTWENGDFLHSFIPPETFYNVPLATHFWPLEGLAEACKSNHAVQTTRSLPACHSDEFLARMHRPAISLPTRPSWSCFPAEPWVKSIS